MLWGMLYETNGGPSSNISIGSSGYGITNLNRFSYAFVTVPTTSGTITSNSLCVKRVQNLSGGNYWGQASQSNVALSLKEFFNRNPPSINIRTKLRRELPSLATTYSYFKL